MDPEKAICFRTCAHSSHRMDVSRKEWIAGKGYQRFFRETSLKTKSFGCTFEGWEIFRNRCFQARDSANQSLNQTPFGRRLVPCYLLHSGRDDTCDVQKIRTMDKQTGRPGQSDMCGRIGFQSGHFFVKTWTKFNAGFFGKRGWFLRPKA